MFNCSAESGVTSQCLHDKKAKFNNSLYTCPNEGEFEQECPLKFASYLEILKTQLKNKEGKYKKIIPLLVCDTCLTLYTTTRMQTSTPVLKCLTYLCDSIKISSIPEMFTAGITSSFIDFYSKFQILGDSFINKKRNLGSLLGKMSKVPIEMYEKKIFPEPQAYFQIYSDNEIISNYYKEHDASMERIRANSMSGLEDDAGEPIIKKKKTNTKKKAAHIDVSEELTEEETIIL